MSDNTYTVKETQKLLNDGRLETDKLLERQSAAFSLMVKDKVEELKVKMEDTYNKLDKKLDLVVDDVSDLKQWRDTVNGAKRGVFATSRIIYAIILAVMTIAATFFGYKTYKHEISKETIIRNEKNAGE